MHGSIKEIVGWIDMVAAIQLALQFSEIYREEKHAKKYCLFYQVYICQSINFGTCAAVGWNIQQQNGVYTLSTNIRWLFWLPYTVCGLRNSTAKR
jgi:hypothetical protein